MITGKEILKKKMPVKATAAMHHMTGFLNALRPIRRTATATIAMTAGFNP